jgi:hypothetical protein
MGLGSLDGQVSLEAVEFGHAERDLFVDARAHDILLGDKLGGCFLFHLAAHLLLRLKILLHAGFFRFL